MRPIILLSILILVTHVLAGPPAEPQDPWAVEDAQQRESLPLYKTIPAAAPNRLTPANGYPKPATFTTWHRSHGDATNSRYSLLDQINRDNVDLLQVAWTYYSEDDAWKTNLECNPVIADGVMYGPTVGDYLAAVDAATGEEIWISAVGDRPAWRGLVYWAGNEQHAARLLLPTNTALCAIDAKTGNPIKDFGQNGQVVGAGGFVAPCIYKNIVVMAGGGVAGGYDVTSGKLLWTNDVGGGGNCWAGMAMDQQRGIAYLQFGAPHPNFDGTQRHGRNQHSNSVVALRAETGQILWSFQEICHGIWDLDISAPPNLVTITRFGRKIDAVAQVTKLGNTLLLDRVTGKPIFPFRLRRAPTSKLPGEQTWPYQPDVQLPEPFVRQTFRLDEVTDVGPENRDSVLKQLQGANFGWFQPFEAYRPTVLFGIHGGAEWTGAAFDPSTGWLYVSANELPWIITVFPHLKPLVRDPDQPTTAGELVYQQHCGTCHGKQREGLQTAPHLLALNKRTNDAKVRQLMKTGRNLMPASPSLTSQQQRDLLNFIFDRDRPEPKYQLRPRGERPSYLFNGFPKLLDHEGYPGCKPPWGTLNAIDLNTGKIAWKVPLGEHPALTQRGIPITGTENFGGPMATAGGLVFCAGTRDLKIRAFDSATGEELWSDELPFGGFAPPATYRVDGRQYVVIAASGGGKLGGERGDAYVAFALPTSDAISTGEGNRSRSASK